MLKDVEPMIYKSRINVPYNWWAGETASRFLISLRDNKRIIGNKCAECNKVYVPPRKVCPTCFTDIEEWLDVSNEGVLLTYTIARRQLASIPKKVPVIYGLIKLDGVDTALLHYIEKIDPVDIKIGMRLIAEFADERNATMQDIAYFKPAR